MFKLALVGFLYSLSDVAAASQVVASTQKDFLGVGYPRSSVVSGQSETELSSEEASFTQRLKKILGVTYFTYCYGPGLHPDNLGFNPNQLGLPQNDGNNLQNQVSIRYKFSENLAIDFQSRFNLILNNYKNSPDFKFFRWQTPRIGISGRLLSGEDWTLTGAVNTDFPYFFPAPLSGYQSQKRTTVFTPGMFASFRYTPKRSRWMVFSVISPRYLIYADPNAVEPQFIEAGYSPQNKPELILAFQPTVGYKLTQVLRITVGTTIEYRKHLLSSWNIFRGSLVSNGEDPAWRLDPLPLNIGLTFEFSPALTFYPFLMFYPIAAQRVNAQTGEQASFLKTASLGMWFYGTLF